ncbi:MAG: tail fiber domain-containing protein, partial [Planctomycetes bacterium]|nr:tail fiber domain-containing protein [Planctomycetota bacterium]
MTSGGGLHYRAGLDGTGAELTDFFTIDSDGKVGISNTFNTNNNWLSGDGDSEGISIKDDGNVGVGTTSPGQLFTISADNEPVFRFNRSGSGNYDGEFYMTSGGGLLYRAGLDGTGAELTDFFTINLDGKVGIGANDPDATLDVIGTLDVSSTSYLNGITLDNDTDIIGADIIQGYNDLRLAGDASTVDLYIASNGEVGIGTTNPSAKLDVNGASKFNGIINTNNQWISGDGGSEGINIQDDGRVSINKVYTNIALNIRDNNDLQYIINAERSNSDLRLQLENDGDLFINGNLLQRSDRRLKENIRDLHYGLSDLMKIKPREYICKDKSDDGQDVGFIAQ